MDLNDAVERAITECIQEGIAIGSLKGELSYRTGDQQPDAITTMNKDEYRDKAWSLPVSDLLYVGSATNNKLRGIGIRTIGDLARTEELAKLKSNTSNPDSLHSFMLCSLVNAIVVVFQKVCS